MFNRIGARTIRLGGLVLAACGLSLLIILPRLQAHAPTGVPASPTPGTLPTRTPSLVPLPFRVPVSATPPATAAPALTGWSISPLPATTSATTRATPSTTPTPRRESVAVVSSCAVPTPADPRTVHLATGITYNTIAGQNLRLDVAWPASPGRHPLVVVVHGGGWQRESRTDMRDVMLVLAGQGYTAASVDYRLVAPPRNRFPAAVSDVRCATRWLRAHAAQYAIDAGRVAALGRSAGGHLVSMLGTAAADPSLDGPCPAAAMPANVSAVVSYYGLEDLRHSQGWRSDVLGLLRDFLGAVPERVPARAAAASPITHIRAGDPPFLLLHGTADAVVPIAQSRAMYSALQAQGVPATLVEIPGAGHAFAEFDADPVVQPPSSTTLAFLHAQLHP